MKKTIYKYILLIIVSSLVCIGTAKGYTFSLSSCNNNADSALTFNFYIDGKIVDYGDPNYGNLPSPSGNSANPCQHYTIPEGYFNYYIGYGSQEKMFTTEDGTMGVLYWYDNPDFEGEPVHELRYVDYPDNGVVNLYGKLAPIIEIYVNGYKKKVVVGKTYSPLSLDPDYYGVLGVTQLGGTVPINKWNYSTDSDYFNKGNDIVEINDQVYNYYQNKVSKKNTSHLETVETNKLYVDNSEYMQFINYESCEDNFGNLKCLIADPTTGAALSDQDVRNMTNNQSNHSWVMLYQEANIPKYYKYTGFVDTEGNEYPVEFIMKEEYAGKAFTILTENKMSCSTYKISTLGGNDTVSKIYNTTNTFDGAIFNGNFNSNYLTHLKQYNSDETYPDNKTNAEISTCVPYDINFKYTYTISNPNQNRTYNVVVEGYDGVKVDSGDKYYLPESIPQKPSDTYVITLKYQDGKTSDSQLIYNKIYTPTGFKINGVHYDFGQEIVVTEDIIASYDYDVEIVGPELPNPTRENYTFKGWFDSSVGGHYITEENKLSSSVLYAQWLSDDKVSIIRPDGIPVELTVGDEFTIPQIPDKEETIKSKVAFNYNDGTGKVDVSEVTISYTKDGVIDLNTGTKYSVGDKITVTNNQYNLKPNYIETTNAAIFPTNVERGSYTFNGWYDAIDGGNKYTSYSGDTDLILYASWSGEEYVDVTFNGNTDTIPYNSTYTLPTENEILRSYDEEVATVTLHRNIPDTKDEMILILKNYDAVGLKVNGVDYDFGEVITVTENLNIEVNYIESYVGANIPKDEFNPDGKPLIGWCETNSPTCKIINYDYYAEEEDLDLYAIYDIDTTVVIDTEEENGNIGHEIYNIGDTYTFGELPSTHSYIEGQVTFVFNDGVTEDLVKDYYYEYTPKYWRVIDSSGTYNDQNFYPGSQITLNNELYIYPDTDEDHIPVDMRFPEVPINPCSKGEFLGWYDDEINGSRYSNNYTGFSSGETYYAHWGEKDVAYVYFEGSEFDVPINSSLTLPGYSYTTPYDETIAHVYLKYNNPNYIDDETLDVVKHYEPISLKVNGVDYDFGETITVTEDLNVEVVYAETILGIELPDSAPDRYGTTFAGWCLDSDTSTCEVIDYNTYNGEEDITLYAKYTGTPDTVIVNFNGEDYEFNYGERIDLPSYDDVYKEAEEIGTISLHSNKNDYDEVNETGYVYKEYEPLYLLINGVKHNFGKTITLNEDMTIEVEYLEVVYPYELPTDVYEEDEDSRFVGWYLNKNFTGDSITIYNGENHIDAYAKFQENSVYLYIEEDGEEKRYVYEKGTEYTFGELPSSYSYYNGPIEFDFNDGIHESIVEELYATFTPEYWYLYDEGYNYDNYQMPGNTIILNNDMWIYPETDEDYTYTDISFPDAPENEGMEFNGWYDDYGNYVYDPDNYEFYGDQYFYADWSKEQILVHFDNNDEYYDYGDEIDLTEYESYEDTIAEVHLIYNNDWYEEDYQYVYKEYILDGWLVNGEPYNEDTITVTEEMSIKPIYIETIYPVTLPTDVYWNDNHEFLGWYTAKNGGTKIEEYSSDKDITLYGHWTGNVGGGYDITLPDGNVEHMNTEGYYQLGVNDIPSSNINKRATIHFDPLNGDSIINKTVGYKDIPHGWLVNGYWYENNSRVYVYSDIEIVPYYERSQEISVDFPEDPVKKDHEFIGWYDSRNGGNKYTSYHEAKDITLYAHYKKTNEDAIEYQLPFNDIKKDDVVLSTVTFKFHNGEDDVTSNVIKKYTPSGWLVDGVHHSNGDSIVKTSDTIIIPDYKEHIISAQFPETPTNENKKFIGWYTETSGGTKISNYDDDTNITLHAQYTENYALLNTGTNFRRTFNEHDFDNISSILKATSDEYEESLNQGITMYEVSVADSPKPVYLFTSPNKKVAYYYSEADVIYMNSDSSNMFYRLNSIEEIDLSGFNSSYVKNMSALFDVINQDGGDYLNVDLSQLDVSNVTNMKFIFHFARIKDFDISMWNTSNVESFDSAFYGLKSNCEMSFSNLNTASATNMNSMFRSFSINQDTVDVTNFDTSNVTDMSHMFASTSLKSVDVSGFDTSKVENMENMFGPSKFTKLDISNFDTSNVKNFYDMFYYASGLKELNIGGMDVSSATNLTYVFSSSGLSTIYSTNSWDNEKLSYQDIFDNVPNLVGQNETKYSSSHKGIDYARIDLPNRPGYFTSFYQEKVKLTLPDGSTEEVFKDDYYVIPQELPLVNAPEIVATITFKPNNGDDDFYEFVYEGGNPYAYEINGETYYPGDKVLITEDTQVNILTDDADYIFPEMPSDPIKKNHIFDGWFTLNEGGDLVDSLEGITSDVTFYAQYMEGTVKYDNGEWIEEYPYGSTVILPSKEDARNYKSDEIISTVTLHFFDRNIPDGETYVMKNFTPLGIKVNGVLHDFEEEITLTEDTIISYEYIETLEPVVLPTSDDINKEYFSFEGWYLNEDFTGDKIEEYSGDEDIDVFANYTPDTIYVYINDDEENPLEYTYGDTYTFEALPEVADIYLGDVTFVFDDDAETPDNVQPYYLHMTPTFYGVWSDSGTYNGGSFKPGDTIVLDSDTWIYTSDKEINYEYTEITIPDLSSSTKEHYINSGNWMSEWGDIIDPETWEFGSNEYYYIYWLGEPIEVHTPWDDYEATYGEYLELGENHYDKDNGIGAQVTFKYHNDIDEDYVTNTTIEYIPNWWLVNGEHIEDYGIYLEGETTVEPDYIKEILPITFPEDPTKEGFDFVGWYNDEENGEIYSSYDGEDDIILHARWTKHIPVITTPDGIDNPDDNDLYTLPENTVSKNNETIGNVTFNKQNGTSNVTKTLIKKYTPNGWLINNVHYNSNQTIPVTKDIELVPDYTISYEPITFPDDPTKDGYTFTGWYTSINGGDKVTESNQSLFINKAMTLYAHYKNNISKDEEYILPYNLEEKADEIVSKVTFKYHNGSDDTTSNVIKRYVAKGWLVDGVYHDVGDVIIKTSETVITPNFNEVYLTVEFPETPVNGDKKFIGWYTEETGGQRVYNYNDVDDITLHARYTDNYATLVSGETIKALINKNSQSFMRADQATYQSAQQNNYTITKISTEDSPYDVYLFEVPISTNYKTYYYTEAETIYLNENASRMFESKYNLKTIDLTNINSSYTTNFERFLYGTKSTSIIGLNELDVSNAVSLKETLNGTELETIDISNWNTSKVESFEYTFASNEYATTINVSNLNTSKATNMKNMFAYNRKMESYDLSSFDTSNVENMSYMFAGNWKLKEIDLSNFNTSKATNMSYMFNENSAITNINLSSFNTENVTTMEKMFASNSALVTLDISSFSTNKLQKINDMLYNDYNLVTVYVSNKWSEEGLGGLTPFSGNRSLVGGSGTIFDNSNKPLSYARADILPDTPGYFTNKYANRYEITLPDRTEEINEGTSFIIPTNIYPKDMELLGEITYKIDSETIYDTSQIYKEYIPNGFMIGETHYETGSSIYPKDDIELVPYYDENIIYGSLPEEPTISGKTFIGWFTDLENGEEITSLDSITEDITLYAHFEDTKYTITLPDKTTEEVDEGSTYNLGENDITRGAMKVSVVRLNYHNDSFVDQLLYVTKLSTPNGWLVNNVHYDNNEDITVTEDIVIKPDYIKTIVPVEIPQTLSTSSSKFNGWYLDNETFLNKFEEISYSGENNLTLHAKWEELEDIEIDSSNITLVKGDTHNIVVTSVPSDISLDLKYSDYDDIISVSDDGLVTALNSGTTTIKVSLYGIEGISKNINVTVLDNEIISDTYSVETKTLDEDIKVVIGAEPETTIEDFLSNIDNPLEYIKVYDNNNNLVEESSYTDLITTGYKLKLVINDHEYDNALVIIRGDINEDGYVDISDRIIIQNHILLKEMIEGYNLLAADVDENIDASIDEMIDISDGIKLNEYILLKRDTLNEKDGE